MSVSQADVDTILTKLEAALVSVEKAQGSNVKLVKAETNLLTILEKFRDLTKAMTAKTTAEDRAKLCEVFGGNCERISRAEAMIKAVVLTEKNALDPRLQQSLGNIDTIKVVLREKNLGAALDEAQGRNFPWRPPAGGVAEPAEEPKPEPAPAPAPAPVPAPAPAPEPEPTGGYQNDRVVITQDAEEMEDDEEADRNIVCECAVKLDPKVDWGPDDTILLEFGATTTASITTTIKPSLPGCEDLKIEFPVPYDGGEDTLKFVFDPKGKTPAAGTFLTKAKHKVHIFDVPDTMGIQNSYKKVSPFGSKQLKVGKAVTEIHWQIKISSATFTYEEIEDFNKVFLELTYDVNCSISGDKSKSFSSDGTELDKPSY